MDRALPYVTPAEENGTEPTAKRLNAEGRLLVQAKVIPGRYGPESVLHMHYSLNVHPHEACAAIYELAAEIERVLLRHDCHAAVLVSPVSKSLVLTTAGIDQLENGGIAYLQEAVKRMGLES